MPWKGFRKPLCSGWRNLVDQNYMVLAMEGGFWEVEGTWRTCKESYFDNDEEIWVLLQFYREQVHLD